MKDVDLIIIGGGPCGLACAIEASQKGIRTLVVEKGCVAESIRRYPHQMTFFSTAENIAIGNLPFTINKPKATREEALNYYRMAVQHFNLNILVNKKVEKLKKVEDVFRVTCSDGKELTAEHVIIATGYFDIPRPLDVKGEKQAHVSRYYAEPYAYAFSKVVIAGGGNTAIETALDLYRNGADVTMVIRKEDFKQTAKYWLLPDIKNRVREGKIKVLFNHCLTEIKQKNVLVKNLLDREAKSIDMDFVLLLTGYLPDEKFLTETGISINKETLVPYFHPETLETNVPGLYLAGTVISGVFTEKVFIENGRLHGSKIIDHILNKKQ